MSKVAARASRRDVVLGFALILLSIFGYELLNHIPRVSDVDMSTPLDRMIPVAPIFVIPYLSFIPLVFVVIPVILMRSRVEYLRYATAIFIGQLIMNFLYLAVPATVPRPKLAGADLFTVLLRDLVWRLDEPVNTFPSNHVFFSVLAICALGALRLRKRWVLFLQVWFGLICLSTLLVHQHVLADVAAGITLGILTYFAIKSSLFRNRFAPATRP